MKIWIFILIKQSEELFVKYLSILASEVGGKKKTFLMHVLLSFSGDVVGNYAVCDDDVADPMTYVLTSKLKKHSTCYLF